MYGFPPCKARRITIVPESFNTVIFEKQDGIAYVYLNRPSVLNAYNVEMRDDMWQILQTIRDDCDIQVVIITGIGQKAFCVGADLTEFGSAPSQIIARQVRFERKIWELWQSIPKPFICAAHGYTLGSGLEMALLCDLRIATEDAIFGLPETSLGMAPAAGGTQTLRRIVGIQKAFDLLFSNRRINAKEALSIGLINKVVTSSELIDTAKDYACQFLDYNPIVLNFIKQAVVLGSDLTLPQALDLESRLARRLLFAPRKDFD
ncbi:enoyl-CoA hydratase/isomerase family protein [SAR202 cluster bacterium AD-802-E10_MRT_200m]|nr:enoyl-CoA hydratase/isomerase family protein [SAR202 cluster bacterium AD-802-E10_MRT_200m]